MIAADVGDAEHLVRELLDDEDRHVVLRRCASRRRRAPRRSAARAPSTARRAAAASGRSRARGPSRASAARRRRACRRSACAAPAAAGSARRPARAPCLNDVPLYVAMRRFSVTVRFGKMPRPSGTRHTPSRASWSGARAGDVAPEDRDGAAGRLQLAARDLERRRLPGAVRAEQREHLAGRHDEVDAVEHVDGAVAGARRRRSASARGLRRGPASSPPPRQPGRSRAAHDGVERRRRRRRRLLLSPPRYAARTLGVRLDLVGRAGRDDVDRSRARGCASHAPITKLMSCSTSSTPSPSLGELAQQRAERARLAPR